MGNRITRVSLVASLGQFRPEARAAARDVRELRGEAQRFSKGRYGAKVGADTKPARTELSALEKRLRAFGKTPVEQQVNLDTDEAKQRLSALQRRLREFGTRVTDARLDADDAQARTKISGVEAALLALGQRTTSPDLDLQGIAAAEAQLGTLETQLTKFDGSDYRAQVHVDGTLAATRQTSFLVDALAMVGPTIPPIAAAATPVFAGLTSGFAGLVAGAGVTALAFEGIGDALKALNDYRVDPTEAHLEKLHQTMATLGPDGREFVRVLDSMRPALQHLQDLSEAGMLPGAGGSVRTLLELMPQAERLIGNVSKALGFLAREGAAALTDPFWTSFFDYLGDEAHGIIIGFSRALGRLATGFAGVMMAVDPLSDDFRRALLSMTEDFSAWGQELARSEGLHEFVAYVREVGPQVWDTLGSVANAILAIVEAAAPVGQAVLPVISALADTLAIIADSPAGPALFGVAAGLAAINRSIRTAQAVGAMPVFENLKGLGRGQLLKRGAAGLSGVGVAMADVGDNTSKTGQVLGVFGDTASGALLGFGVGGPIGAAIGAGGGLLLGLAGAFTDAGDAAEDAAVANGTYLATLDQVSGAITRTTRQKIAQQLEQKGVLEDLLNLGLKPGLGTDAVMGDLAAADQITKVIDAKIRVLESRMKVALAPPEPGEPWIPEKVEAFHRLSDEHEELISKKQRLMKILGLEGTALSEDQKALRRVNAETRASSAATDRYGDSTETAARHTETLTDKVRELSRAQEKQATAALLASDKQLAFNQALIDLREEAKHGKRTLDITTQAGIDNRTAINRAAAAWNALPAKMQNARGAYKQTRDSLIDLATQMNGGNRPAARKLIDTLLETPKRIDTKSVLETTEAHARAGNLKAVLEHLDGMRPTPKARFDDKAARRQLQSFQHYANAQLGGIDNEVVAIHLTNTAAKVAHQLERYGGAYATGGGIHGPGTGTSDDILIRASNNEHMVTEREVRAAGHGNTARGHKVWQGIRHAALVGALPDPSDLPAYAVGGPIVAGQVDENGFDASVAAIRALVAGIARETSAGLSAAASKAYSHFPAAGALGPGGRLTPAQMVRGQEFAQAQQGKPYIWGGVGPTGYDCSGMQSATYNAAVGRTPYQRLGSTSTMPWPGMAPGVGRYTIGWFVGSPGHTSGNIGGLGVESRGGDGVVVGSGARSPLDGLFNRVAHYDQGGVFPHGTAGVNLSGKPELVLTNDQAQALFPGFAEGGPVQKKDVFTFREQRHAARGFNLTGSQSVREAHQELHEFARAIREAGGSVGGWFEHLSDRVEDVTRRLNENAKALDDELERRRELRQARRSYEGSVASTVTHDVFGSGLANAFDVLQSDAKTAKIRERDLRRLSRLGLDGAAFKTIARSGDAEAIEDLDTRGEVRRLERLYADRAHNVRSLRRFAGGEVFGPALRASTRAIHDLREENHHLRNVLEGLEDAIERGSAHGAEHGTRKGMSDRGRHQGTRDRAGRQAP